MPSDKDVKKQFKLEAQREPEKNYPVQALKDKGFSRAQCTKCGTYYWSQDKRETCGDSFCVGGFHFIGNSPAKEPLSYLDTWKRFKEIHEKLGYTPIKRYPVVARWRNDTDFVQAGIYDFQPYVVSGEVEPPANPVIEPQLCLRFNDIDNVGITGAHYVCFDMLGEHAFYPPEEFDKDKYITDHLTWLTEGMGLPLNEIIIHEDAWAGGGNFGPCMEFFCRGLEVSNQVYMQYEQTPDGGRKRLKLNVLDMGQGHERVPWITQGKTTSYETTFPQVLAQLKKITGVRVNEELMPKFLPYSGLLNVDEVEDIEQAWKDIAGKIGVSVEELKEAIIPLSALYSVAEHARALLVALSDGALPSNTGGFYNLRVVLRRALTLIDRYGWQLDLGDICEWHAQELKELYPELSSNLETVKKILRVEKDKYEQTKQKMRQIIGRVVEDEIDTAKLIELYDNQGISPELVKQEAAKQGRKVEIPDNFYALVAQKHEERASKDTQDQATQTERDYKVEVGELPATDILYFGDWSQVNFKAKVLKIQDTHVVLDKTLFYPVSGGQFNDEGTLGGARVVDVFKQGNLIIHKLESAPSFKEGDEVEGNIDLTRRKQLTQHHTSTHIVNAAARRYLGNHINQASAKKDVDKAYIDITHYQNLTEQDLQGIEEEANKIVSQGIEVKKSLVPRTQAEQIYGVSIYQGGAVPGKILRIVDIVNVDAEACGGTHLNNTREAEYIKLLKANKVKDGVVRITFTAGAAAKHVLEKEHELLKDLSGILGVEKKYVAHRAQELFEKWKKARKAAKKKKKIDISGLELNRLDEFTGDIPEKTAELIGSQPQHLVKTIKRFLSELDEYKETIKNL